VLDYELGVKWLESVYEDDEIKDEEKHIEARVKFLQIAVEVCKKERRIKKII